MLLPPSSPGRAVHTLEADGVLPGGQRSDHQEGGGGGGRHQHDPKQSQQRESSFTKLSYLKTKLKSPYMLKCVLTR